ncbi:sulfopyruvate decarboxylase [Litorilinea aerophila]|uniref:Sulfopyruvate decarboxylase n=1 Tax=Litorilinea aerophila TaxID=1204385 RepID=A0A540VH33_9CHLR|nr:thiamine pyrophosphate-binding protein [Litorilinea aerophila]MCC9076390.1 sulfopyruvate decarboxylase [Litorilinea aerophila]GIV79126.1 MAG: decarboxylase [Litorilinea sp.]
MTVSRENSKLVYQGIKEAGIRFITALPETWLVYLLQMAEDDPEMTLIEVAREEEAVGIAAGAYFAGTPNLMLLQNHGFFGAINGIVSLALLYSVPLCMLIAHRGHMGEPYPWHTRGGILTEPILRSMGIPFDYARDPRQVGRQIREAHTLSLSSLSPVALLLTRDLMEGSV